MTHLKIITKASLNELIDRYEMGTNVTTLAKESKYSYNRLKKVFKFYELKKWNFFDRNQLVEECYKCINEKQLLHEEIN